MQTSLYCHNSRLKFVILCFGDRLTSREIDGLERSIPVIIPISAIEQHGPHLPLATDRIIGWHFLTQLEKEISDKVLILPSLGIGCSSHHMEFPGTLSYTHDTLFAMVEDIVESLLEHGFHRIILFNSHGGNQGVAQVLSERLGPELTYFSTITWWRLAASALLDLSRTGPGGVGHAGEFETSLMLHIDPDLVRKKLIEKGKNQATFSWAEGDMLRSGSAGLYRSMYEMTPNGIYGDPTQSSADQGLKISRLIVSRLKGIVLDLYKAS